MTCILYYSGICMYVMTCILLLIWHGSSTTAVHVCMSLRVSSSSYDMYPPPHMTCILYYSGICMYVITCILLHMSYEEEDTCCQLYMYVYEYTYVCMYVYIRTHTHTRIQAHTRTHTHTHTHTHSHVQAVVAVPHTAHEHRQPPWRAVSGKIKKSVPQHVLPCRTYIYNIICKTKFSDVGALACSLVEWVSQWVTI